VTQTCSYTIERDGQRWTAKIPLADFTKLGPNKVARHNLIANALNSAMQGRPNPT
jgi:hypothetical protein